MLSFSIVINTLNRGEMLRKTLEAFRWLRYEGDFEVIVVNGPLLGLHRRSSCRLGS